MPIFSEADVAASHASDQFDPDWYAEFYPDVGLSGLDPVDHYLWIGRRLGRFASARARSDQSGTKRSPGPNHVDAGETSRGELFEELNVSAMKIVDERDLGVADLSRGLQDQQKWGGQDSMSGEQMRRIQAQLIDKPWWWGLFPPFWQRSFFHRRLKRKGLFDSQAYLARYPDVAAHGMDPVRHYILFGYSEGRNGRMEDVADLHQSPSHSIVPTKSHSLFAPKYPEIPIRHGDRRIMIIDSTYPTPDRDSGSVDAVNYIRIFKSLGYSIYFMATTNFHHVQLDEVSTKARDDLDALGVDIIDDRYGPDIGEIVRLKGGYFEKFFLSRVYAGGVFFEAIRTHAPQSRIVFNTVDMHGVREMREGQLEGNRVKIMGAYRTTEREHYLARLADATVVVSAEEANTLVARVPGAKVVEIPLLRDIPGTTAPLSGRANLGFIGGYRHTPNMDAVKYFLDSIWPAVRGRLPDLKFYLMGADMPKELRERTDPGLVVVGHVKDLQSAFDSLRLTVAPLRIGAGAKGKVVSSLSHGLPCIASPIAAEGMGLDGGVLVASTSEHFAAEIVRLCTDDDLWHSLSTEGLNLLRRRYSLQAGATMVESLFQNLDNSR